MEANIRYARTSDGVDIAYAVAGSGPLLLIARPLLRPALDDELSQPSDATWLPFTRTRSVAIWDPRGFGLSNAATPEYTIESSLKDMEAVADAVGEPRFDVLGHRTPSQTAIAYTARHPDRVGRLALRNPSHRASPRSTTYADLPDIVHTHFAEYMQLGALRLFGWEPAARRYAEHMVTQFTPESWERVMEQLEALDAADEAPAVTVPVLVVVEDELGPGPFARIQLATAAVFRRRLAATFPNAELAVVKPGRGRDYTELVEDFLSAGDALRHDDSPSGTAIILFADIVDSTALTERMGDAAFRDGARALDTSMRAIITGAGGTTIDAKTLGDGVLATFPAASQAIAAALATSGAAEACGLALHVGIHAGDVIRESNNVFGGAVNIAARISALSAPGEVLVSRTVADLARTSAGVTFDDRGEHALKGIAEPQRVFAVRKADG